MSSNKTASSGIGLTGIGLTGMVFIVFLVMKLAEIGQVKDWSWWWVTAPLWGAFLLVVAILLIMLIVYLIVLMMKRDKSPVEIIREREKLNTPKKKSKFAQRLAEVQEQQRRRKQ